MTHDELLAKINRNCENLGDVFAHALCAVVELHQHLDDNSCYHCATWYPCPTIQAIEKELG